MLRLYRIEFLEKFLEGVFFLEEGLLLRCECRGIRARATLKLQELEIVVIIHWLVINKRIMMLQRGRNRKRVRKKVLIAIREEIRSFLRFIKILRVFAFEFLLDVYRCFAIPRSQKLFFPRSQKVVFMARWDFRQEWRIWWLFGFRRLDRFPRL